MVTGIPGSFLTERPREAAAPPCRGPLDSRGPGRRRHCRRDRSRRRCPRWDAAVRRGCGSWSPGSPGRRGWWFSAALLAVFGLGQSPYMWDTHWYGPVVVVMIGAAVAERGGDGKWVPRPLITADPHRGAGRVGNTVSRTGPPEQVHAVSGPAGGQYLAPVPRARGFRKEERARDLLVVAPPRWVAAPGVVAVPGLVVLRRK